MRLHVITAPELESDSGERYECGICQEQLVNPNDISLTRNKSSKDFIGPAEDRSFGEGLSQTRQFGFGRGGSGPGGFQAVCVHTRESRLYSQEDAGIIHLHVCSQDRVRPYLWHALPDVLGNKKTL